MGGPAAVTSMTGLSADGIIGHRSALAFLEREVRAPSHSYLFVGPPNVGKAMAALVFAAALVSISEGSRARVMRQIHPDVSVVGPEGRAMLGVDQARQAIAEASLRPVESERKVTIFDEASLMTEAAANALLKTLEEPPARTVFVLVAESEDDLPATVASRCRVIRFGRVPQAELTAALVAKGVDSERAAMTARIAGGSPGLALDLVADRGVGDFRRRWLAVPAKVSSRVGDGFRLAEEMLEAHRPLLDAIKERRRKEFDELEARGYPVPKALVDRHDRALRRTGNALVVTGLEMLASWYLDSASAQYGGPLRNPDLAPTELARTAPERAVRCAELVLDAGVQLRRNQRPRLVLTGLFTSLGGDA